MNNSKANLLKTYVLTHLLPQLQPTSFFPLGKISQKPLAVFVWEFLHWKVKNMEGFSALHWLALRSMDEDSHVEVAVLGVVGVVEKGISSDLDSDRKWQQWMTLMTPKV